MTAPPDKWAKEQWNVGDEALVIHKFSEPSPEKGAIIKVDEVVPHPWDNRVIGLAFKEFPEQRYNCNGFTKLLPLTRRERDEFLTDIDFEQDVLALRFQLDFKL